MGPCSLFSTQLHCALPLDYSIPMLSFSSKKVLRLLFSTESGRFFDSFLWGPICGLPRKHSGLCGDLSIFLGTGSCPGVGIPVHKQFLRCISLKSCDCWLADLDSLLRLSLHWVYVECHECYQRPCQGDLMSTILTYLLPAAISPGVQWDSRHVGRQSRSHVCA